MARAHVSARAEGRNTQGTGTLVYIRTAALELNSDHCHSSLCNSISMELKSIEVSMEVGACGTFLFWVRWWGGGVWGGVGGGGGLEELPQPQHNPTTPIPQRTWWKFSDLAM